MFYTLEDWSKNFVKCLLKRYRYIIPLLTVVSLTSVENMLQHRDIFRRENGKRSTKHCDVRKFFEMIDCHRTSIVHYSKCIKRNLN